MQKKDLKNNGKNPMKNDVTGEDELNNMIDGILKSDMPIEETKEEVVVEPIVEEKKEEVIPEIPAEEAKKEVVPEIPGEEVKEKVEPEIPAEEKKSGEEVSAMTDDEILKELEDELKKAQEGQIKLQEGATKIEKIQEDGVVTKEEFNDLTDAFNQVEEARDLIANELEKTQLLVEKYKEKVKKQASQIGQVEIDSISTSPILKTVQSNDKLKGFVLALNKSEEKPEMKNAALSFIYDWLEGETGVNIKNIIEKDLKASKEAVTGQEESTNFSMKEKDNNTKEDDILGSAIAGLK